MNFAGQTFWGNKYRPSRWDESQKSTDSKTKHEKSQIIVFATACHPHSIQPSPSCRHAISSELSLHIPSRVFPIFSATAPLPTSSNSSSPAPDLIPSFPYTDVVSAHLILLTSAGRDEEVHLCRLWELWQVTNQGAGPSQTFNVI